MHSKRFLALIICASFLLSLTGVFVVNAMSGLDEENAAQSKIKFYPYRNQIGAGGYDIVAYFESSAAVKGENIYEANFAGMPWHFSTAENRDKFIAAPDAYLPEFGGHCAYGVAQGYLVRGDPEAWSIRGGKLYFNYNKNIRNAWLADADSFIRRSENNWPQLNQ